MNCFASPEGEWKNIGQGVWHEDLFTLFDAALVHSSWKVDVEQSETDPLWYRVAPYAVESPVTEKLGKTDNTWLYINTTDPEKVYVEDFKLFDNEYEFEQLVPECGYKAHDRYAKLANNIIAWPRISIRAHVPSQGLYDMNTCLNTELALVLPGTEVADVWNSLGETEFIYGILSPMINQNPSTITVTIEERNDKPGYYRLVGAWSQHGGNEAFEIDTTDPDFVRCPFQDTGVAIGEFGLSKIVSVGETYVHDQGMTKEEFIANYPEKVITRVGNTIRIPANAVVFNFPNYDWLKFYECETPAESLITIPGTSGVCMIDTEDAQSKPEYYTLQGVKVDNPTPGIYICKKGTKATKIVIR